MRAVILFAQRMSAHVSTCQRMSAHVSARRLLLCGLLLSGGLLRGLLADLLGGLLGGLSRGLLGLASGDARSRHDVRCQQGYTCTKIIYINRQIMPTWDGEKILKCVCGASPPRL